ncbi:hypothetical protein LUZ60_017204 [Juncus effusus]|nr:hypothetical protein LUZ60_017204 [Juncus effusus]
MSTGSSLTSGGDPTNASATLGRKLLVHVAENGRSFEFECDGSTLIGAISLSVQNLTGIPISDQLLLCGHVSLDLSHPLSFYKLPQDEREVFLYNKSRLLADSPLPAPENIEIPNTPLPPPPSSTPPIDSQSMDPALKALVSYEHQFRYHFQLANSVYNTSKTRFEVCKRLVREQMVQERALETARENLELTFRKLQLRYSDFLKCFSRQHKSHVEILNNFERDLEKLKRIRLHEKLQREGRRVLGDLVHENELRKCAQVCVGSHRQFEGKVLQLKSNFGDLRKKVEGLFESMSANGAKELDGLVKEHQRVVNEQKSIMQALSKDVETSKKLVDECLHDPHLSASLRPHDAVSAVGRIYEVHEKSHLPKMQSSAHALHSLLSSLLSSKNSTNLLVHHSMQKVKVVQFQIKNTMSELHAFQEVMTHQEREFESLRLVSGVGLGYKACLAEVVRRREGGKLYLGLAGQLAERLAVERASEIRRREVFFKNWGRFVPSEIMSLMGLFDNPSSCDVNVASFDGDLLSVDLGDVERLVPASLIGSGLGSFIKPVSEDVSQMEGCDEVAGTSKLEVENAKLKAELASAIAIICGFNCEMGFYDNSGNEEDQIGKMVTEMKERTEEALGLKDEYANQLQLVLDSKKEQCGVYERRIRELEERLSEQYNQKQRNVSNNNVVNDNSNDDSNNNNMDESSSATSAFGMRQQSRNLEGGDENMMDLLSGTVTTGTNETGDNDKEVKLEFTTNDDNNNNNNIGDETDTGLDPLRDEVLELKRVLEEKSMNLEESEGRIRVLSQEVETLNRELKHSRNLLDESQMNCAHLENCLHEAREEARTNKCTAERRSTEYEALRSSALKIHSLFERLRVCVNSPGVSGFADSLRSLTLSLAIAAKKDDGEEFQQCIKVLSDKVGFMSHQSAELAERCSRMETAHGHLVRELEEKRDLIRNLYSKLQLEKQVSKDKITFGKFDISELAAFVRNPSGNYEAVNRNCPNYYLCDESIALFSGQNPTQQPEYVIGQIVHIEGRVVQSDGNNGSGSGTRFGSNPYGLPVGCEYFVVTVALLPDSVR